MGHSAPLIPFSVDGRTGFRYTGSTIGMDQKRRVPCIQTLSSACSRRPGFWSWWSPSSFWPSALLELFLLGEGTLSQCSGGSFSADAFFADAMTIVVGIEFVKMLMLHTPRAVTDVLLFAIARQLVVNHSSAVDTLLGVAAVALIFVIKKFLHTDGDDAPAGDGRP